MLDKHNGFFVKRNAWKALLRKIKTLHWNWTLFDGLTSFDAKWRFCVVFWSVWKWPQPVRPKYHAVRNISYVLLFSNDCKGKIALGRRLKKWRSYWQNPVLRDSSILYFPFCLFLTVQFCWVINLSTFN